MFEAPLQSPLKDDLLRLFCVSDQRGYSILHGEESVSLWVGNTVTISYDVT